MLTQRRMKRRAKLTCALTVERQSLLVFATLSPHANVGILISCAVNSHRAQRLKAAGGSVHLPGTGEGLDRGFLSGLLRKLVIVPSRGGLNEARDLLPRLCTHVSGLVLAISQRPQFFTLWISPMSYWSPVGKTTSPPSSPHRVIQKQWRSWRSCVLDFRCVWLLHLLLHAS